MALGLLAGVLLLVGPTVSYGQTPNNFPITINGEGGTGNASSGTLGNDAGWRMIGVPVADATAADLVANVDDNGSVIEFDLPSGNMFYRWDNGSWIAPSSGESLTNGRGYILFLFDDSDEEPGGDDDPLDPDLTLDVDATGNPGPSNDVTVDNLSTSATFHLLANPYDRHFRVNQLEDQDGNRLPSSDQFGNTVQIWDGGASSNGNTSGNQSPGSYCTFTIKSGGGQTNLIDAQYASCDTQIDGRDLSVWQAFFLERTGSQDTEVVFDASQGVQSENSRDIVGDKDESGSTNNVSQNGSSESSPENLQEQSSPDYVQIGLTLAVEGTDGTVVARDAAAGLYFHPDATAEEDGYDASKLTPLTSPYAVIGPVGPTDEGEAIKAQESRPLDAELPLEVPLRFRTEGEIAGTASIRAARWEGVPSDWTVTLIDTKGTDDPGDDEEYELIPSDTTGYTFEVGDPQSQTNAVAMADASSSEDGGVPTPPDQLSLTKKALENDDDVRTSAQQSSSDSTRFKLQVEGNPLPVELASFDATLSNESATLQWTTASETNNAGFEVQRRGPEADSFKPLGFVESRADGGTTQNAQQYQFETDALEAGRHVFRLRQVDTDGSATLSDTTAVEVSLGAASEVRVAPNPVQTESTVTLRVREGQEVSAGLYDMLGRKVRTLHEGRLAPRQAHRLSLDASGLTSGAYILRIQGERFEATRRITIVQ
jgi:hypothetical protein